MAPKRRYTEEEGYMRQLEASKAWKARNVEHVRTMARKWKAENPEKVKAYQKAYREKCSRPRPLELVLNAATPSKLVTLSSGSPPRESFTHPAPQNLLNVNGRPDLKK